MPIEPVGSIPRLPSLIEAGQGVRPGCIAQAELRSPYGFGVQDVIARCEATGSTVVTDGKHAKESFAIYPLDGLTNVAADGNPIPVADGKHALRVLTTLAADPATVPS